MKRFMAMVLAALMLTTAVGAFAAAANEPVTPMDSAIGAFDTQDLEGNAVSSNVFAESKLTLVNVWGTCCPPCKAEIPDLGKLDKEIEDFQVLGILIDAGVKDFPDQSYMDLGKKILSDSGAEYTSILPDQVLSDKLIANIYAVPTSFFVDEKGQMVGDEIVGSMSYDDWKATINEKLAEVSAG